MKEITIGANDAGRRLDRFLRKYFRNASLSEIYKIIRKDVKVDGRRRNEAYMLQEGEVLSFYLADEVFDRFTGASDASNESVRSPRARRQFNIVYEDDKLLIADKPFGLLTHGDISEKKNHLANQVKDYLIEKGEFNPRNEKIFSPAPANRIDRNTTGLVLFGKTAEALKELNKIIREDRVRKFYRTVVCGTLTEELVLEGSLVKDEKSNKVRILTDGSSGQDALAIRTIVHPLEHLQYGRYDATLVEVELVTGRSHQIRAHLASIGHPIIGDTKYAAESNRKMNAYFADQFGLSTQLLHAYRLEFDENLNDMSSLDYLSGKTFIAGLPARFEQIVESGRTE